MVSLFSMNTRNTLIIGIVILILGGAWWYTHQTSYLLPLESGDTVASWNFQGAYTGNADLSKKAQDEIARLQGMLGGDQSGKNDDPTDYDLDVGIANQYDLMGDGAQERTYLEKALAIDSVKTGIAWHNLGSLMNRLGAYTTARTAFAKAVEAQPQVEQYHLARIRLLTDHFASDTAAVDGAFAEAAAQFGDDAAVLQMQAEWFEKTDRTAQAISALTKMKALLPKDAAASVDAEIKRLQSK